MNQQTLQNVAVVSQVCAPHAAGLVTMCETSLDEFSPSTEQTLSLGPLQPLSIRVDCLLLSFLTHPMPLASLLLLRNISAYTRRFEFLQNRSTMVSLVGDHLFDATQIHLRL